MKWTRSISSDSIDLSTVWQRLIVDWHWSCKRQRGKCTFETKCLPQKQCWKHFTRRGHNCVLAHLGTNLQRHLTCAKQTKKKWASSANVSKTQCVCLRSNEQSQLVTLTVRKKTESLLIHWPISTWIEKVWGSSISAFSAAQLSENQRATTITTQY